MSNDQEYYKLSWKEQLELEIAAVKQKKINEMLKLQNTQQLQEIVIRDVIIRTRKEYQEKLTMIEEQNKEYKKKIEFIGQKLESIENMFNSVAFLNMKYKLQNEKAMRSKELNEAKLMKIEWYKKEIERFKNDPKVVRITGLIKKRDDLQKELKKKRQERDELWEEEKQTIIKLVEHWKKSSAPPAEEKTTTLDTKAPEDPEKPKKNILLLKLDNNFSLVSFNKTPISDNESEQEMGNFSAFLNKKARRSYEVETKEPENRRHSHEIGKRSWDHDDDGASNKENANNSKRVRFDKNVRHRLLSPDDSDPKEGSSVENKSSAKQLSKPKSPNKKVVEKLQKPVFKAPKSPSVKKGILKETAIRSSDNTAGTLRRTKSRPGEFPSTSTANKVTNVSSSQSSKQSTPLMMNKNSLGVKHHDKKLNTDKDNMKGLDGPTQSATAVTSKENRSKQVTSSTKQDKPEKPKETLDEDVNSDVSMDDTDKSNDDNNSKEGNFFGDDNGFDLFNSNNNDQDFGFNNFFANNNQEQPTGFGGLFGNGGNSDETTFFGK